MKEQYKPIKSMKEVPDQVRKLRREYIRYHRTDGPPAGRGRSPQTSRSAGLGRAHECNQECSRGSGPAGPSVRGRTGVIPFQSVQKDLSAGVTSTGFV